MGFNGYNDGINRTAFNPLAWGDRVAIDRRVQQTSGASALKPFEDASKDQNHQRLAQWLALLFDERDLTPPLPDAFLDAYFELVQYPIQASASMNDKFLFTDLTYVDSHNRDEARLATDTLAAQGENGYAAIQTLIARYNSLESGKWDGIMSSAPRERHVFEMPRTATAADADKPLPASWGAGDAACQSAGGSAVQPSSAARANSFVEQHCTVSINAAHFARSGSGNIVAQWHVLADLGVSGSSVVFGEPGRTPVFGPIMTAVSAQGLLPIKGGAFPWLEYDFATTTNGPATLALHLLPTFAVDSDRRLRYAVALDSGAPVDLDASGPDGHGPDTATWSANVLRNSAIASVSLGLLAPGKHTLRLLYRDPGVVFEHLVITFPGAPPAYPVPPETR
jgi:hypothetical protein